MVKTLDLIDEHMSSSCYMGLVGDCGLPLEVDSVNRATAVKQKASRLCACVLELLYILCSQQSVDPVCVCCRLPKRRSM